MKISDIPEHVLDAIKVKEPRQKLISVKMLKWHSYNDCFRSNYLGTVADLWIDDKNDAVCLSSCDPPPGDDCASGIGEGCGIYSIRSVKLVLGKYVGNKRELFKLYNYAVVIANSGKIAVHETGIRSERAEIIGVITRRNDDVIADRFQRMDDIEVVQDAIDRSWYEWGLYDPERERDYERIAGIRGHNHNGIITTVDEAATFSAEVWDKLNRTVGVDWAKKDDKQWGDRWGT